jgi:hypothetical protein
MGFLDDIKKKAQGLTKGHEEQVEKGVDKGSEMAKEKFGHEEQVDKATGRAKEFLGDEQPQTPSEGGGQEGGGQEGGPQQQQG